MFCIIRRWKPEDLTALRCMVIARSSSSPPPPPLSLPLGISVNYSSAMPVAGQESRRRVIVGAKSSLGGGDDTRAITWCGRPIPPLERRICGHFATAAACPNLCFPAVWDDWNCMCVCVCVGVRASFFLDKQYNGHFSTIPIWKTIIFFFSIQISCFCRQKNVSLFFYSEAICIMNKLSTEKNVSSTRRVKLLKGPGFFGVKRLINKSHTSNADCIVQRR